MTPIKAIIYDADGMVITPPSRFSAHLIRLQHLDASAVLPFFQTEFKPTLLGQVGIQSALKPYLPQWHWMQGVDALLQLWYDYENCPNRKLLQSIQSLRRQGILCVLATNQETNRARYLKEVMHLDDHFDQLYFSCDIGSLKPEHQFFDRVFQGLQNSHIENKDQVLYWDDRPPNVKQAADYGFVAKRYATLENYLQAITTLIP